MITIILFGSITATIAYFIYLLMKDANKPLTPPIRNEKLFKDNDVIIRRTTPVLLPFEEQYLPPPHPKKTISYIPTPSNKEEPKKSTPPASSYSSSDVSSYSPSLDFGSSSSFDSGSFSGGDSGGSGSSDGW